MILRKKPLNANHIVRKGLWTPKLEDVRKVMGMAKSAIQMQKRIKAEREPYWVSRAGRHVKEELKLPPRVEEKHSEGLFHRKDL